MTHPLLWTSITDDQNVLQLKDHELIIHKQTSQNHGENLSNVTSERKIRKAFSRGDECKSFKIPYRHIKWTMKWHFRQLDLRFIATQREFIHRRAKLDLSGAISPYIFISVNTFYQRGDIISKLYRRMVNHLIQYCRFNWCN